MKRIFLTMRIIYLLLITLLFAGVTACKNATGDLPADDTSWDISSQVIEKEINGIFFKFCLLNEQGEPATVFNEGENFSFYFLVTNQSKKDLYYHAYLVTHDKNFLRVYSSSNYDFGKSFEPYLIAEVGIAAYPFNDGEIRYFKVPWIHEKEGNFPEGQSIPKQPLKKGNYYTGFKYSFYFQEQQNGNFVRTDSINFKINFKIQ